MAIPQHLPGRCGGCTCPCPTLCARLNRREWGIVMGRYALGAAALLLIATAALHAGGLQMIGRWTEGMPPFQAAALRFVWISDSIDWTVAAILWAVAAWKLGRPWLAAAAIAAIIPWAAPSA